MRKKDTLRIGGAVLATVLIAGGVFIARSGTPSVVITDVHPAAAQVPFTRLTQGRQSTVDRRVNYVITSPTQLNQLWKSIDAKGQPPEVDFKTHTVIAVFAGAESSSTITIAKIEDRGARMVSVAIARPDCTQGQGVTSPYEIVAVPATSLPLTHEDIVKTVSCQ